MKYIQKTWVTGVNAAFICRTVLFLLIPAMSSCIEIIPEGEMPSVSTTEASNIYYTSAVAEGTVTFPEHAKEVGVMFGTDENDMKFVKGTVSEGKISVQLNNLKEGTMYYYAAAARVGRKEIIGKNKDFTTFVNGPVDLGLPSGIKWASANLGAEYPTQYGDYYAWGEVRTKQQYDWTTYLMCKGTSTSITKYCNQDKKWTLDSVDDAASCILGGSWRIPTQGEWAELQENCALREIRVNGVKGIKVYNKTTMNEDVFIFLPYAGTMEKRELVLAGIYGDYWTSDLYSEVSAYVIRPYSNVLQRTSLSRCIGRSIRPVCK